jgi:hypothetical protein
LFQKKKKIAFLRTRTNAQPAHGANSRNGYLRHITTASNVRPNRMKTDMEIELDTVEDSKDGSTIKTRAMSNTSSEEELKA